MWYRAIDSMGKSFVLLMSALLFWGSLSAQEMIRGKRVRTGIWQGRQIEYLEGEIALILKPGVSKSDVLPVLQSYGATLIRDFDKLGWGLIELSASDDALSVAPELTSHPLIEVAEPNMVVSAFLEPDDPYFQDGHQWALKNWRQSPPGGTPDADIDAPEAWGITQGSSSIIIAILDTGIPLVNGSLSHPDLDDPGKFILGPDYVDRDAANGVRDENGHGTHVTGIASAETDNNEGIAGVAGDSRVMVIQVFNADGDGT